MPQQIIIIAGEPSADMHAAALIKEIKKLRPNLQISGIGGPAMRQAGAQTFTDLTPYAVIGFWEVLKHFPKFKKAFHQALYKIKQEKPSAVILIDYPGFNLRLAKKIKQQSPQTKVIYYISPQIWAWGEKRIELIKSVVDKMIVIFPFEYDLYKKHGINVSFVGHPLAEHVYPRQDRQACLQKTGLNNNDIIISLLPGSREEEVKRILPLMLKSAKLMLEQEPQLKFLILKTTNVGNDIFTRLLANYTHLPIRIINNNTCDFLAISSFAWVCSGTATLETAMLEIPMLIVYKTSFPTWFISKQLIKLPYIGLVNVVAGKKIVPEFIQYQATAQNIINCTKTILKNSEVKKQFSENLRQVKTVLGQKKASLETARVICEFIN